MIDLPLEPGFVVTVEPGVYFVPAILDDPENRRRHREAVDWGLVDQMIGFGGTVRQVLAMARGSVFVAHASTPAGQGTRYSRAVRSSTGQRFPQGGVIFP